MKFFAPTLPRLLLRAVLFAAPAILSAKVVGTNPPSQPVTATRINALPAADQPAWQQYLARSRAQWAKDQAFFADEMNRHKITTPTMPKEGRSGLALNRPAEWFASDEARKLADNVISFQTPAGGWSKNMNYADHARAPGERFAPGNAASAATAAATAAAHSEDNDKPADPSWHYVGTFDNNGTISQIRFIAHVAAALDAEKAAPYRAAVQRGLDYIFAAQFPNGGFPQVYPLEGGYHDSITYNDKALINILEFLRDVADAKPDFAFVSADMRTRATASIDLAVSCILKTQIVTDGRRTGWCQQHDALTLAPTSARNYEMPSQSASESDGIMIYLMGISSPSPAIVAAVHDVAAWLKKTELSGVAFRRDPATGERALVKDPAAGPLWARYYQIGTDQPLFGDRDKSIHDDVSEISKERRNGYSWFNDSPANALKSYAKWAAKHPAKS
jgi:PelA/Pel-15E family pectate lyase